MKNDSTELQFFAEVNFFYQRRRALIFLLMRMSAINLVFIFSCTCMAYSVPARGQNIENTNVKLAFNKATIKTIFAAIEEQTDFSFVVPSHKVNTAKYAVSLVARAYTVKEALDLALKGTLLRYEQQGNFIYISLESEDKNSSNENKVSRHRIESRMHNSLALVTGTVKDASTQEPLAGVNIIVKGTTNGTTTDVDGEFGIDANENDVLVFSFIGFQPFETNVSGRTAINIFMEADVTALKEVVVNAGYWDVKDREKTGNISKVKGEVLESQPVSNPIAGLQGRVPGVEITQLNGIPGGNFRIRIRGQNSIASGNEPLYIIDGVPYFSNTLAFLETSGEILGPTGTSPLNNINPANIESIEILKDADATAIYGSRGSNGVILITTKKGRTSKNSLEMNFYTGIAKVWNQMELLNTEEYLQMRKEALKNDNITTRPPDLSQWDSTRYTDWQKLLIGGTAQTMDAQIRFSGGNTYTQYSLSGGYHKETTVFPGNNSDQRLSTQFSLTNLSPNKKLRISVSAMFSTTNSDLLKQDLTMTALILPPNAPELYDANGKLNWQNSTWSNPMALLNSNYNANTNNLVGNVVLGYAVLPNLEVRTNLGSTYTVMKAVQTTPTSAWNPAFAIYFPNMSFFSDSFFKNWIVEPQLNWKPKIEKSSFDLLVGTTFLDQKTEGLSQGGIGFVSESLMRNLAAASQRFVSSNNYSQYRYNSIYARINFTHREKYIINLTGRKDGSSRFGPENQFANFGAIGTAWIFSKEPFVDNTLRFLSFGKIRASYGVTGNDQIGDYSYLDTYSPSGPYQGASGLNPTRLYNPNFGWETNHKMEAAMELGFMQDRIMVSGSYYRNRSSNQLVGYPLPPTTGFVSIQNNLPAIIENTGIELELNTTNIRHQEFTWTSSVNFTIPRNKLIEYPNLEGSSYANQYVVGEPLNVRKLYHFLGVDQITGVYQFEDINGDGVLSAPDRQTAKVIMQDFYGGLYNRFQYRGVEFEFLFQFVKQTGVNTIFGISPGGQSNQPRHVLGRWQKEGDHADIQRFSTLPSNQTVHSNLFNSDYMIGNASFIRLKNVSMSYSVPAKWLERIHISNVKVFVLGQNLITLTDYVGVDPENQNIVLPPLGTIAGGLKLTF